MRLTIESEVPLPGLRHAQERMPRTKLEYPWDSMRPGDSFLIPWDMISNPVLDMNDVTADGNRRFGNGVVKARTTSQGIRVRVHGKTANAILRDQLARAI